MKATKKKIKVLSVYPKKPSGKQYVEYWAKYDDERNDEVTPWIEAFVNARKWVEKKKA